MTSKLRLTRRQALATGTAGLAAGLAGAPAIAQTRPRIVVQTFGGLFEKTIRENAIAEFERAHNTEVVLSIEDDTTLLPKLRAARSRAPFDVVTLDNNIAILGAEMGLWAPDQSAQMPNAADIYKTSKPPMTANYGTIVYEYAFVYNPKKVANPTSWSDLWQDGIVAGIPHITQSYGLTFLYIASILNGGSGKNLDPGFAAIKRLKKFKIYKNVSEGLQLFQQGEVDAALFYGHRGQQMIDMGVSVLKTRPKEGTWGQRTGMQIPRNAANLDGARAWVNWTLSVPYQTAFARNLYSPTNRKVELPPDLAAKHVYGETHVDSIREVPWDELLPQRDALLERWTREIG
jgi:putative spermidine/putrescine transport system substrate-binding protein